MTNKDTWYKCTMCGREGRVGRCCGTETRIPINQRGTNKNRRGSMKYKVFSLYEDLTDGNGLTYRQVFTSDSILKCVIEIIKITFDDKGYGGAHGWRVEYASDLLGCADLFTSKPAIVTQSFIDHSTIDVSYRVKAGLYTEETLVECMKYKHRTDLTRGNLVNVDCIDFDSSDDYDLFTIRFEYKNVGMALHDRNAE